MPAQQQQPHCTTCMIPLRRRKDRVFSGTVLAVGSHKCAEAKKIFQQAATGAQMFARQHNFVHIRYISSIITADAWIQTLQDWTTTHVLTHWIIPMPQKGTSFVVSHRVDSNPDKVEILQQIQTALENAGSGPLPPRIIMSWEAGTLKQQMTNAGDLPVI